MLEDTTKTEDDKEDKEEKKEGIFNIILSLSVSNEKTFTCKSNIYTYIMANILVPGKKNFKK